MKILLSVFMFVTVIGYSLISSAANYCGKSYDEFRQLRYWGRISLSINDYKYGSGDTKALKLVNSTVRVFPSPIKPITDHFTSEFNRLLKGNLPIHDVDAGSIQRSLNMLDKLGDDPDIFDKINASEEARRNALYGPNPGAIYCNIAISRSDFPVLYEIVCSIVTNKELANYGLLVRSKYLGFNTPEHIQQELTRAITARLEDLRNIMERIRKCPSK